MAKKTEWVYREILFRVLEKREMFLSQSNISRLCRVSIGNVNKSLSPLVRMNAIEKKPRGFMVINPKKALLYWAGVRNLQKDIIYRTNSGKGTEETEDSMPPVLFTAYSGFSFRFKTIPSDYSEVIVYSAEKKIRERFPPRKGKPNILVLKPDPHLSKFRKIPLGQLFVDLWNLDTWYADEFVKELEARIDGIIGG